MIAKVRNWLEKNKMTRNVLLWIRRIGIVNFLHCIQDKKRRKKLKRGGQNSFAEFCANNDDKLEIISNMLEDDRSKDVLAGILQYRKSFDRKYLKGIIDKDQYFDKEIVKFSSQEIMVDCGAYIGDTIETFAKRAVKYRHIYAFEPDGKIIDDLKKNIDIPTDKYTYFPVGAWSKKATLRFSAQGSGVGNINDDGGEKIEVDSIDNLLSATAVTFVKMDIEGAEMDALKGAEKVICMYKPKLAICIYHRYEDLYEIPMYIKSLVPEYRLFIRHYSDSPSETVLYAVI